jgi:hypothetical protein
LQNKNSHQQEEVTEYIPAAARSRSNTWIKKLKTLERSDTVRRPVARKQQQHPPFPSAFFPRLNNLLSIESSFNNACGRTMAPAMKKYFILSTYLMKRYIDLRILSTHLFMFMNENRKFILNSQRVMVN